MYDAVEEHPRGVRAETGSDTAPADELERHVRSLLEHAVDAHKRNLKVYQSLRNLDEVIGTEYGDRVLYELIQNAHDAHRSGNDGRIAIELAIRSESEGVLYVANGGKGFRWEDVEAIRNLATSAKEVGEGIGNKGLGFRSIEALTDDVHIYSRNGASRSGGFDGYCFRFAEVSEIEDILHSTGVDAPTSAAVAKTIPRYLVPRPLEDHPNEIAAYARRGYMTVIAAPLRTPEAVTLASRQVEALAHLDAPLLLFLDRIAEIRIDIERPDHRPYRRRLSRRQTEVGDVPSLPSTTMYEVDVGEGCRFLVVRREVDRQRILEAVGRSISTAPQLQRWLNWKGAPVVSVAVGMSTTTVTKGRLYNFLPMGEEADSPFLGYLDAPFFADIDRRDADLELPLNETLMEAAAETCAAAALSIVERDMAIPARAVFDLFAWSGEQAGKLNTALNEAGSSLQEATVIPAIVERGQRAWSCLSEIRIWPEGTFSVLKDRTVAKYVGAQLVSEDLDSKRIERLKAVASRGVYRLTPSEAQLAEWSEAFARSLLERKAAPRTWSRFYDDLPRVFETANAPLEALDGKAILYDRSGKLRRAGGIDDEKRTGVFVRGDVSKGKRKKAGVPLPPATLARRYRFLYERISLRRETLEAFTAANLVREYDPVEALAGLKSALGREANDKRRQEALAWAFQVWRAGSGVRLEEELQKAGLYVPTLSGWHPAGECAFSSSWTSVGRVLENYLIEAADDSPDCRRVRDRLLVGQQNWPVSVQDAKRHWTRFLELIGVVDGFRPVPARLVCKGSPSNLWDYVLQSGKAAEGLDKDWCAEVAHVSFKYPYTEYRMKGEAWRLPGQIEHDALPEGARESMCMLIFEHLKAHGTEYFQFEVGRFERNERDWDRRKLPTPLASFLRSKPWIAAVSQEGLFFRSPKECWGSRVRRRGPPRFIDRVPEALVDLSEGEGLSELAFGDALCLRDWHSQATAVERLRDLADVAVGLSSNDRPTFRNEYRRAWQEVVETGNLLPADLSLIVTRWGQLEALTGESDTPAAVIVTEDAQSFEARILSSAGQAVLEVGPAATERVAELLEVTGAFVPRRLDGIGVKLLVDGAPFAPRASDPLLTSLGLEWLPEVIVIGHELRGERLERGIQSTTVDRRARTIRVRHCEAMKLVVDDDEVSTNEELRWYAFEHEDFPTLILNEDLVVNWRSLARTLSGGISRLIDGRLRSLEPLLLRLAFDRSSDRLEAPDDEALASALECDVRTILDLRAALRTDLEHILHLLIPVVGYYGDPHLARQFLSDVDRAGNRFDAREWLELHLAGKEYAPDELIDACEQSANRTELRGRLDLDYATFNRVLLDLGEAPLSNEAELRQLYDAYLGRMRPAIIDRLRRHHAADFRAGRDLAAYVERKNLAFLAFDTNWILTRETLEMEAVEAHVSDLLAEALGEDVAVELPAYRRVVDANRKAVREFAMEAAPVIGVWCQRNDRPLPEPWQQGDAQTVARHLENSGLLDFEWIGSEDIPGLCRRAGCWPDGMPETLDGETLGLTRDDVKVEEKRRERERQQREIERRSILFAGTSLDTGDAKFAENLQELAAGFLENDETWFERSRQRTRLVAFDNPDQPSGGAGAVGAGGGARRRERQLTDTQRQAMGLTGEWLAYQFLCRRHSEYVDESCWVSENRAYFFGGDGGNDAAGYDFRVMTPQAEWLYEVKSSLEDSGEFELTANELRVAGGASKDGRRRYRILYVPYVFSPDRWYVLQLPNPMGEATRNRFTTVGRGSVRLRFERR
ncbi:sacsin N-terminal ATP-binding-like domain-containing protein [Aquisalimonas sp. 2447]|uniref:sacsin N-terminal ATP-binding-like domain-containing protein n=1 Tax=Aquisalimonas sp. 2447 TaxID=2740807 RepID=UPI00352FFA53